MHKCALYLAFITFLLITVQRRGGQLFPAIKEVTPKPPPGENINAPIETTAQSEFTTENAFSYAYLLYNEYQKPILAILALGFLLIFTRGYHAERKYKYIKIREEDLGLMKIIRDNAGRIWDRYRPRKNVVWLDEWRD